MCDILSLVFFATDRIIIFFILSGVLEEWRPLTRILAETLRELQSGRKEVYVPRLLLSRLTQRMPQFAGGDQHDSHELLRHLLEAVREEDLRRYQTVILDKLGEILLYYSVLTRDGIAVN